MKVKALVCLCFLSFFSACTPSTNILSLSYTLQLPDGTGVNADINFTDFASTADGALTFSDAEGDVITFTITGLAAGQTFQMGNGNTTTGTFNVVDQGAQVQATIQDTGVGFINVNSLTGTGASITAIAGSFKINIENESSTSTSTTPTASSGTGTIQGNFNYVASTSS